MAQTTTARSANGSSGSRSARKTAPTANTTAATAASTTIGAMTTNSVSLINARSSRNGSSRSPSGRSRTATRIPKKIRNGRVRRQNTCLRSCRLFTCCVLQEFRGAELVGRPARRRRREIGHGMTADSLVEALHHHRVAAGSLLQLRKSEQHAEADEEHQHEHGTRQETLQEADHDRYDVAHPSAPSRCAGLASGTS